MTVQENTVDVTNKQIVFALLDEIRKATKAKKLLLSGPAWENITITMSLVTQQTNPQGTVVSGYFPSDLRKYYLQINITEPQNDLAHVIARNILAAIITPVKETNTRTIDMVDLKKIPNESAFLALIEKAKKLTSSVEAVMGPAGG